jgi:O-antigen/teichoic acid export membrane protein
LWRLFEITRTLTSGPFDPSTPAGRSQERHRRVALTALATAVAKLIGIGTTLISVPLTVGYLGPERYGLWMTITSVVMFLSFADLGMGNGLLNAISEAHGKNDREMARTYVSSALAMFLSIAILFGLVFLVVYPRISWSVLFNVSSAQAIDEAGPALAVFAVCFLLNVPLGIVQRVQMGYQEGYVNSLWQGLGSLLGLVALVIVVHLKAGLPFLVLAVSGGPIVASGINGTVLFVRRRPWLRPARVMVKKRPAQRLVRLGALFLVLQGAVALAYSSDNLVAARTLGVGAVAEYSVCMRLFSIAPIIVGMVLTPLWPAYGESLVRGDIAWIRKTLRKTLALTLVATGVPAILLAIWGAKIIDLWIGGGIDPSPMLLLGLGVWTVLTSAGNAVAMLLNGAGRLRFQVACAVPMSFGALTGKILLSREIGLPGIIWGTNLAYIVFIVVPFVFYVPRILRKMERSPIVSRTAAGSRSAGEGPLQGIEVPQA